MIRGTFTIAVAFLCSTAAAESPSVTFTSPCECSDNHGKGRWAVKNDPSMPPTDASGIQSITVFGWTHTRFPFHTSSARKLNITNPPVITVIGKAFWDIGHAPKDQRNQRRYLPGYAVWEIHPVMKMEVQ